jgi:hypothetical protein
MGIDSFKTSTSSDNTDDSTDEQEQTNTEQSVNPTDEERALTAIEYIGVNIKDRLDNEEHNISVENGKLTGDVSEVAKLFAVMTMDFGNADFQELMDNGE